ncbi:MAG: succinate dehydrogenase cytochrome b subunit [Xanthomonadaceae bacterium]|nr:succinate dehydrogenase cytochrome b subunit [Xanthomonadaceae bacterium]
MIPIKSVLKSSVGRKFIMGASGLALLGFLITHLAGNLLLFIPGGALFNEYAQKLESLGMLLYVAEFGLAFLFVFHSVIAIRLKLDNLSARGSKYAGLKSKGGPSRWNIASVNMAISGLVMGAFLIWHIKSMKFGPSIAQGYVTEVKGTLDRDLYRLVFETFKDPIQVWLYVGVMIFLGLHLRHGFWSAFQSLGLIRPRFSKLISAVGVFIAVLMAAGFLGIPLYIHFILPGVKTL